jgi:4-carboxymuconolactone decarboxylase
MLTPRETELVAIAASAASNCVPCLEYHVPKAREASVSDDDILAAIRLAERVKQAPARKVSDATLTLLGRTSGPESPKG